MKQSKAKLSLTKEEKTALKKMGRRVTEIASKKGVSIEKLAYEGGISKGYLYDIAKGNGNPSFVILSRIAEALEIDLTNLFSK